MLAGVVITAPISGANLNPAVTIGLFAAGRVKLIRAILYIIVQCAGGIGKLECQSNLYLIYLITMRPYLYSRWLHPLPPNPALPPILTWIKCTT